jgi:glycerol-3-phosphate dehydrogenase
MIPSQTVIKQELIVRGNKLYTELCSVLKFPFKRNGAIILSFNDEEIKILEELKEIGRKKWSYGIRDYKKR